MPLDTVPPACQYVCVRVEYGVLAVKNSQSCSKFELMPVHRGCGRFQTRKCSRSLEDVGSSVEVVFDWWVKCALPRAVQIIAE